MFPGRTTALLVQGIIEVDTTTWPDISPFIDIANELVTECCASVTVNADGSGGLYYSSDRLQKIETWLAAHFYAVADQQSEYEQAGPVRIKYQFKIDLGLNQTKYGQQALMLDTRLGLAGLNNSAKIVKARRRVMVSYMGENVELLYEPRVL